MAARTSRRRHPLIEAGLGLPVAGVVALVLHQVLGVPLTPTWGLCVLGAGLVLLAVELYRGVHGPDRSPLDRRRGPTRSSDPR